MSAAGAGSLTVSESEPLWHVTCARCASRQGGAVKSRNLAPRSDPEAPGALQPRCKRVRVEHRIYVVSEVVEVDELVLMAPHLRVAVFSVTVRSGVGACAP